MDILQTKLSKLAEASSGEDEHPPPVEDIYVMAPDVYVIMDQAACIRKHIAEAVATWNTRYGLTWRELTHWPLGNLNEILDL